jgi:hypothetical protein
MSGFIVGSPFPTALRLYEPLQRFARGESASTAKEIERGSVKRNRALRIGVWCEQDVATAAESRELV